MYADQTEPTVGPAGNLGEVLEESLTPSVGRLHAEWICKQDVAQKCAIEILVFDKVIGFVRQWVAIRAGLGNEGILGKCQNDNHVQKVWDSAEAERE